MCKVRKPNLCLMGRKYRGKSMKGGARAVWCSRLSGRALPLYHQPGARLSQKGKRDSRQPKRLETWSSILILFVRVLCGCIGELRMPLELPPERPQSRTLLGTTCRKLRKRSRILRYGARHKFIVLRLWRIETPQRHCLRPALCYQNGRDKGGQSNCQTPFRRALFFFWGLYITSSSLLFSSLKLCGCKTPTSVYLPFYPFPQITNNKHVHHHHYLLPLLRHLPQPADHVLRKRAALYSSHAVPGGAV